MRPLKSLGLLAAALVLIGSACSSPPSPEKVATAALNSPAPREAMPEPVTTTTTAVAPPTTVAVSRSATPPRRRAVTPAQPATGGGRCGGDLPPCWVMNRESGGNINAYNPTGCGGRGCYGKWQCDPRTCSGKGTEAQQDAEARALWDNGRGCAHWAAC